MDTTVRAVLKEKGEQLFTIEPSSTVIEAVRLMNDRKIGALVVIGKNSCVSGIITERDILKRLNRWAT